MPVIRISEETMGRLKAWAKPLEDTAESAFAKVLDVAERNRATSGTPAAGRRPRQRRRARDSLSQKAFRRPLLEVLYEAGGKAPVDKLRLTMKERMASSLLPGDFETGSTGEPHWWKATCRARNKLRKEGYLRDDSKRGVWELSGKGVGYIEKLRTGEPGSFIDHLLAMPNSGEDADFDCLRSDSRRIEI